MSNLVAGLLDGLRSAYCSHIASQKEWVRNLRRLLPLPALKDSADFLIQIVCDRPPTDDDYPPPPFTGGQCEGVMYRVKTNNRLTFEDGSPSILAGSAVKTVVGPVTGLGGASVNDCGPIGGTAAVVFHAGTRTTMGCPGPGVSVAAESFLILERADGLPDECGDPEFDPGDFEPSPINIDLDVTYGPNNEFNLTVPVVIAPVYVAFDGTVNVPVTFDISPEISLEGTWTLFPDAKLDINFPSFPGEEPPGSTGDDDPPPSDPGEDDPGGGSEDDPDTPGKPDPEKPEEPEERIHFLICRAVVEPGGRPSSLYQEIGPDLYVPRLGSARFGATVDGVTFWSNDIDIKGLNTIIECPIPFGATRFTVNASQGVAINYAPVSTDPQNWPNYLQIGQTYVSDAR